MRRFIACTSLERSVVQGSAVDDGRRQCGELPA